MLVNNVVINNNKQVSLKKQRHGKIIDKTPSDKLDRYYRSQGLLGKLFDKIQSTLNIGLSRKNLKKELQNNTNNNEINKKLDKYYNQQKNSTELTLDLMTGLGAASTFKLIKKIQTYSHLYVKNSKFEKISTLVGLGISAISGMFLKPFFKSINKIGMKKEEKREERTILKDMGSGFVDGIAAPLTFAHKLGLIGAVGINSLSRFGFNKKADKEYSFSEHLTNSWVAKTLALSYATYSAFKFHKRIDVLEKAIIKSKENIKNIQVFKSTMPLSELIDLGKNNLSDKKLK